MQIENLKVEKVIDTSFGNWSNSNPYYWGKQNEGKFSINLSSALSFLIKKAGAICEHYASDLFITWQSVEKSLTNPDLTEEVFLFGFREMGVDSNSYVKMKFDNYNYPLDEYTHNGELELYALLFKVEEGKYIEATLNKMKYEEEK